MAPFPHLRFFDHALSIRCSLHLVSGHKGSLLISQPRQFIYHAFLQGKRPIRRLAKSSYHDNSPVFLPPK